MRKADYDLIAGALAGVRARKFTSDAVAIVDDVSRAIGSELLNTNRRFDLSRFMRMACGVDQPAKRGSAAKAYLACYLLVIAYENGKDRHGSIDWSEVDQAFETAREALKLKPEEVEP